MTGSLPISAIATNSSTTSQFVRIPSGFTLVGVEVPIEATSTTFTIVHSQAESGTYTILKDPLAVYATIPGDPVSFTIGTTSLGTFFIPPTLSATLYSFVKIIMGSSETIGVNLIFKQIA